jgi:hypothetical protein
MWAGPGRDGGASKRSRLGTVNAALDARPQGLPTDPGMTNDELSDRISLLEAEIERLARVAERCWKIILIAKIAIVLGGLTLLATLLQLVKFDQLVFLGSITALLGGVVVAGSNAATLGQIQRDLRAAEQLRTKLIDQLEFSP